MADNEMKKKVKRIFEGLLYHCMEMSDFMSKNMTNPYFQTEEGKRLMRSMIGICTNHVSGLTEFMRIDEEEKKEDDCIDIEKFLKSKLI